MKRCSYILIAAVLCLHGLASSQDSESASGQWPEEVREVTIKSTLDGKNQSAMFYCPESDKPLPLLVGLHSWSGNYRQARGIPYAKWCIKKKWAFIHPDFRGPNDNPQACGSPEVVQDIRDAVEYAIKAGKIDPKRVYLVGLSGGGYAAMLMAGKSPELWAGVSAWVGISDLQKWREQCIASSSPYVGQIERCCGGKPSDGKSTLHEYKRRSAITWIKNAKTIPMQLSAGIDDDCVPVSHSINAFNALAKPRDRLPEKDIRTITTQRQIPKRLQRKLKDNGYGDKTPLLYRKSNNVELTIFKGGHEIVYPAALAWLEKIDRKNLKVKSQK